MQAAWSFGRIWNSGFKDPENIFASQPYAFMNSSSAHDQFQAKTSLDTYTML